MREVLKTLIIGSGSIGIEYAKILRDLGAEVSILDRSNKLNTNETNLIILKKDFLKFNESELSKYTHLIICVQPKNAFKILNHALKKSSADILVEKPVTLFSSDLRKISSHEFNKRVYVAFNRRMFTSVIEAKKKLIDENILSIKVTLNEFKDRIRGHKIEMERWGICNTIHMFDLAFYLFGTPNYYKIIRKKIGDDDIIFLFSTFNGIPYFFSYGGGGNWSIEALTNENKYLLNPIETLQIQKKGEMKMKISTLKELKNETSYKPGFLRQTMLFLEGKREEFVNFQYYKSLTIFIEKFFDYKP